MLYRLLNYVAAAGKGSKQNISHSINILNNKIMYSAPTKQLNQT